MTLLVISTQDNQAIILSDVRVSQRDGTQSDEMNKFFEEKTQQFEVCFFTAGNLQLWKKFQEIIDIDFLFSAESVLELKENLDNLMKHSGWDDLLKDVDNQNVTNSSFAVIYDTRKKEIFVYIMEYQAGGKGVIREIKNRTMILGSGAEVLRGKENSIHTTVWSKKNYELNEKMLVLCETIGLLIETSGDHVDYYQKYGVSQFYNISLINENGMCRTSYELSLMKAVAGQPIEQQDISVTENEDGTTEIKNSLDGEKKIIKKFGDNLSRDGSVIKKL